MNRLIKAVTKEAAHNARVDKKLSNHKKDTEAAQKLEQSGDNNYSSNQNNEEGGALTYNRRITQETSKS